MGLQEAPGRPDSRDAGNTDTAVIPVPKARQLPASPTPAAAEPEGEAPGTNALGQSPADVYRALALAVTEKTGPYRLYHELGKGTFALVRLGVHDGTSEEVAVKHMRSDRFGGRYGSMIENEFAVMSELWAAGVHGIPRPIESGRDSHSGAYFAVQVLKGPAFYEYLDDLQGKIALTGAIPPNAGTAKDLKSEVHRAVLKFQEIVDTVGLACQHGILHTDLKPSNARFELADLDSKVKVLDWGLHDKFNRARTPSGQIPSEDPGDFKLAAIGTPGYMSPEQLHHMPDLFTEATAVYQLGELLGDVLNGPQKTGKTGSPTANGVGGGANGARVIAPDFPYHSSVFPEAAWEKLHAIYSKAIQPRPCDRYHTCAELKREIADALELFQVTA